MKLFLGEKDTDNFIRQIRICCNDITITEFLDFVFETNILGAKISDKIKSKKPKTFTLIANLVPLELLT
jgi:hypothetical protein